MSDDWKAIGFGGTADEFLGEIIDRHLEMMLRAARAIFAHARPGLTSVLVHTDDRSSKASRATPAPSFVIL
jgi:hypothetical protein